MDQCNLTGTHVALMMDAMNREPGVARDLDLSVSANKLEKGVRDIISAIEQNKTPSKVNMRMIEFTKEDHFKRLVQALQKNTTIRSLDISKASLPYDAGPETCDALRLLFAENTTLEELDISGEQAHLEVTRFGIGLNHALTGLKYNKTLKILRIEYQNLSLEGANTLASVIEANPGLTHIYCEHNDLNLQGFTILINALANNYTILDLPFMSDDRGESMKRIKFSVQDTRKAENSRRDDHHGKSAVRKTLTTFGVAKPEKPQATPQDLDEVLRVLNERWEMEVKRLATVLERNRNRANGVEGFEGEEADTDFGGLKEALGPMPVLSDHEILEQVLTNTTPRVELGNPVDNHITSKVAGLAISEIENESISEHSIGDTQETPRPNRTRAYSGSLDPDTTKLPKINNERMFEFDGDVFQMEIDSHRRPGPGVDTLGSEYKI